MRIPGPIESLSNSDDGEVVFFTDVLLQGVLAQIGYAPGQYNPNLWEALMGVIVAFRIAEEEEPSYGQFSNLASERGHFVSAVPTSQKSWRNRWVLLSGDWELPSGMPVRFHIPTAFQIAGRSSACQSTGKLKQPNPTQSKIRQVDKVRLKVPTVDKVYLGFLFTKNLIRAHLVNPTKTNDRRQESCRSQEDERILKKGPHDGPKREEKETFKTARDNI
ncbi:unnamed protein product [Prunus armeniaca]